MKWLCSHSCFCYYPAVAVVVGCAADYKTLHERARTSCQPTMKFCWFLSFIDFEFAVSSPPSNFVSRSCCELLTHSPYATIYQGKLIQNSHDDTYLWVQMYVCVCTSYTRSICYLLLMIVAIIVVVNVIVVKVAIDRHDALSHQHWQRWSVKQWRIQLGIHSGAVSIYICRRNLLTI